ncbi:hypothetical protein AMATHDRAFT_144081 [Amanita thiersii Skay4041]|uniref:Yeast cell wall synthesis Kre9/Knh1-like N-terminal domain-containing protein n=1 Tax=Amanita thiersii Skay4041 TaxID=703135 RepID=A0A2A9NT04_9AGAR|nr:hypothetical protein AMATHDRAFT_144081 [Amanita thiersii Skay4041]
MYVPHRVHFLPSSPISNQVTSPSSGGACHGGQPCTVNWVDDGRAPLLSDIGVANIGLYTGQQQLLQTIEPVDVSKTHSFTFTPDTKVGPNSGS